MFLIHHVPKRKQKTDYSLNPRFRVSGSKTYNTLKHTTLSVNMIPIYLHIKDLGPKAHELKHGRRSRPASSKTAEQSRRPFTLYKYSPPWA